MDKSKKTKPQMDVSITNGVATVKRKTRRDVVEDELLAIERFADAEMFGDDGLLDYGDFGNK
jgi:hypothetical protein